MRTSGKIITGLDNPKNQSAWCISLIFLLSIIFSAIFIAPTWAAGSVIEVSPSSGNFGSSVAKDESKTLVFTLENTGADDVKVKDLKKPSSVFMVEPGLSVGDSILAGESKVFLISFNPTEIRSYSSHLTISYYRNDDPNDILNEVTELSLEGSGAISFAAHVDVSPSRLSFDRVSLGESERANLVFTNTGEVDVNITAVDLPAGAFVVVSGIPGTIQAFGTLDALVAFTPLLAQNYNETLRVVYDNGVAAKEIKLSGVGIDTSRPAVAVTPRSISFGEIPIGLSQTEVIQITNTGNVPIEIVTVDDPNSHFQLTGLTSGTLDVGEVRVATVTFTPDVYGDYSSVLRILFDRGLSPKEITLSGSAADIKLDPYTLNFPNSNIGDSPVMDITLTNNSATDLEVKGVGTGLDVFSVSGIKTGDIIRSGGSTLTCQVTFTPQEPGYFENNFYVNVGPVQDEEADQVTTRYSALLKGIAYADFFIAEQDTFTADHDYKIEVSASTASSGRLFVLLLHDPLSAGKIYAMDRNGNLVAFPANDSSVWQNLWYKESASPGLDLDLSQVDFRGLGCSQCQGEPVDNQSVDFQFGNIIITPPSTEKDEDFNNAADFKYMPGMLYMVTYVKDASSGGVFDFNQGLLEMQLLSINPFAGTWRVTSRYNNENRMHPTQLVVTENGDGNISAVWPGYNVTMIYGTDKSGYVMTFSMGIYNYTFDITDLTADTFSGYYTCVANGQTLDNQPVCGVIMMLPN